MRRIGWAFAAAASGSAVALSLASLAAGFPMAAFLPPVLAAFWIFSEGRGMRRLGEVPFPILTTACAVGILSGLSAPACLTAQVCALAAWDMRRFHGKSRLAPDNEEARRAEKRHMERLVPVLAVGALTAACGLFVRVRLGFAALLGLGILLAVGFLGYVAEERISGDRT